MVFQAMEQQSGVSQQENKIDENHIKVNYLCKTFDIEEFLRNNYNGSIVYLSSSNYHLIRRPFVAFLHYFKLKGSELKQWTDTLYDLSLEYPDTIQFCIMDFEDAAIFHLSWNELDRLGLNVNNPPLAFAVDIRNRQHEFDEEFTMSTLIMFCKYLKKNCIYRSNDLFLYNLDESYRNVIQISGDNFRELVEHNEKDVFVTLHSKYSLEYEMDLCKVPFELKDYNDRIVFYAIYAHFNYIPLEYRVSELPTSFLILAKNKSKRLRYVHKYDDGLDIMRFISKHTNISFKMKSKEEYDGMLNPYKHPYNRKLRDILIRLDIVDVNARQKIMIYEDGFLEFLESILEKVDDVERQKIEMEIVTLLLSRLNNK